MKFIGNERSERKGVKKCGEDRLGASLLRPVSQGACFGSVVNNAHTPCTLLHPTHAPSNYLFRTLAGVPVHYARYADPRFGYGTRGKPYRFYCDDAFRTQLNQCFDELWRVCPLGEGEVITSAGCYVDKPGSHRFGRGFDLDAIFWADTPFITFHYPQDRALYLGVEAILRKHFGTVLNYEYDAAHQDHFDIDNLAPTGFFPQHRSRVLFLQMALTYLFDRPVAIDGRIGPQTNTAVREMIVDLGFADADELDTGGAVHNRLAAVWMDWLDRAAEVGFSGLTEEEEKTPLALIEELHAVIADELGGQAARKKIETALTTFTTHEATEAWLKQFREES